MDWHKTTLYPPYIDLAWARVRTEPAVRDRRKRGVVVEVLTASPGNVMKCHVLSCSGVLGRLRPPRLCFVSPRPVCRSSIAFRSPSFRSSRRRCPGRTEPFSARIARAPGRAFAPARFARLIARARGPDARRTSPVHFSRLFSRRREPEGGAVPGTPHPCLPPHLVSDCREVKLFQELFL